MLLCFYREVTFLEIFNLFPGSWVSNCYVLVAEDKQGKKHAAVIDPSANSEEIVSLTESVGAHLEYIILTHGHFDHIISLDSLREATNTAVYIHRDDAEMLSDGKKNAYKIFFDQDMICRPADKLLLDGDKLTLGDDTLEVISTPGHSKGSICLKCKDIMITGDTLFAQGYGRYDLHGGNATQLISSLRSFESYDKSITIYPGHGGSCTLGEALDNIF